MRKNEPLRFVSMTSVVQCCAQFLWLLWILENVKAALEQEIRLREAKARDSQRKKRRQKVQKQQGASTTDNRKKN